MDRLSVAQRVQVVKAYYENGHSNKSAFRALRTVFGPHNRPSESAIGKIVRKFEDTGSVANVKTVNRVRPRRSDENIASVREDVTEHPNTSLRRRAQHLNLRKTTLYRILKNDLSLYPYKIQLTQEIKPRDHLKRLNFANWIQDQMQVNDEFSNKIFFSDEAHFHLNGYVNKQNCRVWAEENPREFVESKLYPEKVTVWCALFAGGIIGPFFFESAAGNPVTVNGERYRAMLNDFLWPILRNYDISDMWFQQDGATCHTAHATIDLLETKFQGRIITHNSAVKWPPRSCDLTPLDFFLWGYLKSRVYVNRPTTIQQIKNEIRRCIDGIDGDQCQKVIANFNARINKCRLSRGGHLEDIIFHT